MVVVVRCDGKEACGEGDAVCDDDVSVLVGGSVPVGDEVVRVVLLLYGVKPVELVLELSVEGVDGGDHVVDALLVSEPVGVVLGKLVHLVVGGELCELAEGVDEEADVGDELLSGLYGHVVPGLGASVGLLVEVEELEGLVDGVGDGEGLCESFRGVPDVVLGELLELELAESLEELGLLLVEVILADAALLLLGKVCEDGHLGDDGGLDHSELVEELVHEVLVVDLYDLSLDVGESLGEALLDVLELLADLVELLLLHGSHVEAHGGEDGVESGLGGA